MFHRDDDNNVVGVGASAECLVPQDLAGLNLKWGRRSAFQCSVIWVAIVAGGLEDPILRSKLYIGDMVSPLTLAGWVGFTYSSPAQLPRAGVYSSEREGLSLHLWGRRRVSSCCLCLQAKQLNWEDWMEYSKELFCPVDTTSTEEREAGDSEVDQRGSWKRSALSTSSLWMLWGCFG